MRTRLLALASLVALQGCYTYVPVETSGLGQGAVVRARMAQPGSFELREITAHNIRVVDGELVRTDPSSLVLSALWLDAETGSGFPGEGWTVEIPASSLQEVSERRISRWKTAAVVAAGALVTWFGFDALGGSNVEGGRGQGGGQTR